MRWKLRLGSRTALLAAMHDSCLGSATTAGWQFRFRLCHGWRNLRQLRWSAQDDTWWCNTGDRLCLSST